MSTTTREAAVRAMCRDIARYIGEQVSPGLGEWPEAWEIVGGASDAFDETARQWVESGHAGGYQELEQAGVALVEAWRRADAAYQGRAA